MICLFLHNNIILFTVFCMCVCVCVCVCVRVCVFVCIANGLVQVIHINHSLAGRVVIYSALC